MILTRVGRSHRKGLHSGRKAARLACFARGSRENTTDTKGKSRNLLGPALSGLGGALAGGILAYFVSLNAIEVEIKSQQVVDSYLNYITAVSSRAQDVSNLTTIQQQQVHAHQKERFISAQGRIAIFGNKTVVERVAKFYDTKHRKACHEDNSFLEILLAMRQHTGDDETISADQLRRIFCGDT